MSSNLKFSQALKNAQMDAITGQIGANGKLRLYSGAQPASPDTAVGAQVMLAELACNAVFAPATVNGVLTLNPISNGTGTAGAGTGTTATWFRFFKSDGTTAHVDGTVGTTGCDLNLNNTSIAQNQVVSISSFTMTDGQ